MHAYKIRAELPGGLGRAWSVLSFAGWEKIVE